MIILNKAPKEAQLIKFLIILILNILNIMNTIQLISNKIIKLQL
jgi:hypothetical protein